MSTAVQFIHKLREKPEPVRRQIVIWTASLLTVIIFFIWLATLMPEPVTKVEQQAVEKAESVPGPISMLGGFLVAELKQVGAGGRVLWQKLK